MAELFKQSRLMEEKRISCFSLTRRRIEHGVELLGLLKAVTGDDRFESLFNEMESGGEKRMFAAFDILYENGKQEGIAEGRTAERSAGLQAIVRSLKPLLGNVVAVCEAVRCNREYADVTEEEIERIYAEV